MKSNRFEWHSSHTWHTLPAVLLVVCMALPTASAVSRHRVPTAEHAEPGQTIVVGRLSALQDGKQMKRVLILVARKGSSNARFHVLKRPDGMFFWALEPGDYVLAGLILEIGTLRIPGEFKVPHETRGVYIGTLNLLTARGGYGPRIEDEHTSAFDAFRKEFPGRQDPVTDLMQLQERIGTYKQEMDICAPGWGIECTKKYRGIIPLEPDVMLGVFTEVSSLTPTFRWQGSSLQDVSYDIVIYKALNYKPPGASDRTQIPGPVVAYGQGLTEPEYRPPAPLKPGSKYYWSVRLRRDEVVSTWSRRHFFRFALVAATWAETAWFGFSTPETGNN